MVDFNNEATITRSARNILEQLIIEKRQYYLDALEAYNKARLENRASTHLKAVVQARIKTMYLELLPSLQREDKKKTSLIKLKDLKQKVMSKNINENTDAFNDMSRFLYEKKLIMWDSMKTYDRTSIEEENEFHGLD